MNTIHSQLRRARARIFLGLLGRALCVTLFAAMVVTSLAVLAAAVWVVDTPRESWSTRWLIGTVATAIVAAAGYAMVHLPSLPAVAVELDRRFGLRERISSFVMLDESQRTTPFAAALVQDAERRAKQLTIADKFSLHPNKWSWLPVSMIPVLALVLFFAEPAQESIASSASSPSDVELSQVSVATEQLKKRIQAQRRKAEIDGVQESEDMFRKLETDLDKISKQKDLNRKDAMIAINDLKKTLEQRREQLGSPEQMQRAIAQMKGLESGPGEKVAESIEKGEFGKANELVKDLAKKLKDGKLSDADKQQLAEQIQQMQEQLQQAAQEHQAKKEQLQQQIEKARREGRGEDAAKMQQELNGLEAQDSQMQKMQKMADAMKQAAEAMESGDMQNAADALQEIADDLNEMQQELSEMEELQQAMDDLSQCKNQMRCGNCGGAGCEKCNNQGGKGGSKWGRGLGSGTGPETDLDANTYDTQVRGDIQKGEVITAGTADGPNRKGVTQQEIQSAVDDVLSKESDPLENQKLPRDEREHAEQYFNRLRESH